MNLYILLFALFAIIIFIYLLRSIKSLDKIKKYIGIFWLSMLGLLLYGMLFETTRGFIVLFKEGLWIFLCIFLSGIVSVILEKRYKNISITYFLIWYFGIPILFTISINYSLWTQEIGINNSVDMGFYIGFFLFVFLSILGFISWIKEKYQILIICFIVCIFFYCPFLFFSLLSLYGSPK